MPELFSPTTFTVVSLAVCYLFGAIPFGLIVGWSQGVDIRTRGSGNIGATNVGRTFGKRYGLLVFALDFLKGFGPVLALGELSNSYQAIWLRNDLPILGALAAVLGHVFPVWLRFRGGKAGAVGLGVGAVLSPLAMAVAVVVFAICLLWTRFVSLGTILGSLAYLVSCTVIAANGLGITARSNLPLLVFAAIVAMIIIARHAGNIRRLTRGEEPKVFAKSKV